MTGRFEAKLQALGSLGVLARAEETLPCPEGLGDGHAAYDHTPVWAYEKPALARPYADQSRLVFEMLPPGLCPEEAAAHTRLFVFIGATAGPELRSILERDGCLILLFEPDPEALAAFLDLVPPRILAQRRVGVFLGDPATLPLSLGELIPESSFEAGFPVFYVRQGLAEALPEYVSGLVEYVEFLFWRTSVYPLEGQQLQCSRPVRDIERGAMFDQQKHLCENLPGYLSHPSIAAIKGGLAGETAVLVAAGPGMEDKLPLLKELQDRAVIICVHRALPVLLDAGVTPHFTVINDTSYFAARHYDPLPESVPTMLVAHCLASLGGGRFRRTFLFGEVYPEVFGERPTLRLHGSVISTAYALAMWLGCSRCILVGAQLAGNDQRRLAYTPSDQGAIGNEPRIAPEGNVGWPLLYPVDSPAGRLYTTLNFRDAALWLLDEIRANGVPCVNTTPASILFGRGVELDEHPVLPAAPGLAERIEALAKAPPPSVDRRKALAVVCAEAERWRSVAMTAGRAAVELHAAWVDGCLAARAGCKGKESLAEALPGMVRSAMTILEGFDKDMVSGLVERYPEYCHSRVYAAVFGSDDLLTRAVGLHEYFSCVAGMSRLFCGLLVDGLGCLKSGEGKG